MLSPNCPEGLNLSVYCFSGAHVQECDEFLFFVYCVDDAVFAYSPSPEPFEFSAEFGAGIRICQ